MKDVSGSLISLPTERGFGLAKAVFHSRYFQDVVLVKLFHGQWKQLPSDLAPCLNLPSTLYYTGVDPLRKKRWTVLMSDVVSEAERAMSKRTSGGEIWVEDTHLGAASEAQMAALPEMLVYGFRLIEKYAGQQGFLG